jgi:hypothetical protein
MTEDRGENMEGFYHKKKSLKEKEENMEGGMNCSIGPLIAHRLPNCQSCPLYIDFF